MQTACVQDLVSPILAETKFRKESSEDVGILILGDSADRNLAFDICLAAETPVHSSLPLSCLFLGSCNFLHAALIDLQSN